MGDEIRLAVLVTHGITARYLLRGQLAFLRRHGFAVTLLGSPDDDLAAAAAAEGVPVSAVPMRREISPLSDLAALVRLRRELGRLRPQIVSAGTPKAGLLGMLAARMLRVPVRVYTLRGLRLETATGVRRRLLRAAERVAAACAHRVVCVSESLRRRYLELGLAPPHKTVVLGTGSSNGVDVDRFRPAAPGDDETARLRSRHRVEDGDPVIGFVGRLTRDKGVEDLARAFFEWVLPERPRARLLVLGDFERGDPPPAAVRRRLDHPAVLRPGFVTDSAPWYRLMDVLAFPSRREGLPNVPLEAAASGVPVVGYAVTGTVDAVENGATGALVPAGDAEALGRALCAYLDDGALRRRHGEAARLRAARLFAAERVWQAWANEYRRLLAELEAQ